MTPSFLRAGAAVLCVPFFAACLGPNYHVAGSELDRIAAQDPAERGVVHGVQQLSFASDEVQGAERDLGTVDTIVVSQGPYRSARRARRRARLPRRSARGPRRSVEVRGDSVRPRGVEVRGESGSPVGVRARGGSSSSGSGSSNSGGGSGDAAVVIAVIAAAIAGGAILAVAATEGARYDGWLELNGTHPLHLYRSANGENRWASVPLSLLTPEMAAWAEGAVIDPNDGTVLERGRLPLNRQGWALSLQAEASSLLLLDDERTPGGGARIMAGGFPFHYFGLYGFFDVQGASGMANIRVGGEVQAFFPALGPISIGAYGEAGWLRASRSVLDQTRAERGAFYGGGAIIQIDLSTRLALDLRGGLWRSNITERARLYPTFAIGISVY